MAGEGFQIVKAQNGQYFWRLRAGNGQIIGNAAETYTSKQHAINMADQVRKLSPATPIHDATGE